MIIEYRHTYHLRSINTEKSPGRRTIISALQVEATGVFVVVVAAVGAGVDLGDDSIAGGGGNAPGIVGIAYHSITLHVQYFYDISLDILHIGVSDTVHQKTDGRTLCVIQQKQYPKSLGNTRQPIAAPDIFRDGEYGLPFGRRTRYAIPLITT